MHKPLYHHITTHNVQAWSDSFIRRLIIVLNSSMSALSTPLLDKTLLLAQYQISSRRLFLFDYDGTLTPIVRDPAAALPSELVLSTLKKLAVDPKNSVWIISGRDQAFLQKNLGNIQELGLSAEHGSFIRHPRDSHWENLAAIYDLGWQEEILEVFQRYVERTPGAFIEQKRCAITWHYRPADPILGAYHAQECHKEIDSTVARKWDIEVMKGKANLEVRPSFINKGEICKRLVSESIPKPDFVFCAGDDFTDEDMFRGLKSAGLDHGQYFTVMVSASNKTTLADWHLPEPADVVRYTASLCGKDPLCSTIE